MSLDQVILERHMRSYFARIALASAASAQLTVDAPRLVQLADHDV
jgi:hypothetical protein